MEVLKYYFMGYSYDEITKLTGVSKGSTVNIVRELREGRYPELGTPGLINELRYLAVRIKKQGLTIPQASLGLRLYGKLKELGVEPQTLTDYVSLCKKISPKGFPADKFVHAAIRLTKLEQRLGKEWFKALDELESRLKEKTTLTSTLTRLSQLIRGVESIKEIGVEKVCKLSMFIDECEKLGYSADKLRELVKLADEERGLRRRTAILKGKLKKLTGEVERAERKRMEAINRDRRLQKADLILKTRTTTIACAYCGSPIPIHIPPTWELSDSMRRGLMYQVRCQNCGGLNRIDPRDILASVAWDILTT